MHRKNKVKSALSKSGIPGAEEFKCQTYQAIAASLLPASYASFNAVGC